MDLIKNVYKIKFIPKIQASLAQPRKSTTVRRLIAISAFKDTPDEKNSVIYCPVSNKWKCYKNFSFDATGFGCAVSENHLYIMGGFCNKTATELKSVILFILYYD